QLDHLCWNRGPITECAGLDLGAGDERSAGWCWAVAVPVGDRCGDRGGDHRVHLLLRACAAAYPDSACEADGGQAGLWWPELVLAAEGEYSGCDSADLRELDSALSRDIGQLFPGRGVDSARPFGACSGRLALHGRVRRDGGLLLL